MQRAFNQCHEVLRDPGKELLVFMLTDKDRKQSKNVPYSYPVAYAMKGNSMTNKHLEFLVDKVRNILKERRIPVLCEAYDGQWHKFVTEDKKGQALTKLHGHDNWNKVSSIFLCQKTNVSMKFQCYLLLRNLRKNFLKQRTWTKVSLKLSRIYKLRRD